LVSCGGTSKADFAQDADPVCSKANSELATVTRPANFKQLGEMAGKVAASTDTQVKALRDLDQPKKDKGDLSAILGAMDGTVSAARKMESGVAGDDGRAVEAATGELRQAATKADDGARAYGLAQCGKGGRDAVTNIADATNPLLKQQLINKADAICKDASRKIEGLPEPTNPRALSRFLDQVLPVVEKVGTDLKALHVPQSDKAAFDELLTLNDRETDLGRDFRAAAASNDLPRLQQLGEALDRASQESTRKAAAFGLKECALEE
jgi:hypothetical protein